jgi:Mycoplasma protein of unknown function, DUF285
MMNGMYYKYLVLKWWFLLSLSALLIVPVKANLPLSDTSIRQAVDLWTSDNPDDRLAVTMMYGHVQDWNVSLVTDMNRLFRNRLDFEEDISRWDVSHVTDMELAFYGAAAFTHSLSDWNMSSVTRLGGMFVHASSYAVQLCWPTLQDGLFLEAIFCGTAGAAFHPCCQGMPEHYKQAACCSHGQPCPLQCTTNPSSVPSIEPTTTTTTPTTSAPSRGVSYTSTYSMTTSTATPSTNPSTKPSQIISMESHATVVGLHDLNLTIVDVGMDIDEEDPGDVHVDDLDTSNHATTTNSHDNETQPPYLPELEEFQKPNIVVGFQDELRDETSGSSSSNTPQSNNTTGFVVGIVAGLIACALVLAALDRKRRQKQILLAALDPHDDDSDLFLNEEAKEEANQRYHQQQHDQYGKSNPRDHQEEYDDDEPRIPVAIHLGGQQRNDESIELSFDETYYLDSPSFSQPQEKPRLSTSFLAAEVGSDCLPGDDHHVSTTRKIISRVVVQDVRIPKVTSGVE